MRESMSQRIASRFAGRLDSLLLQRDSTLLDLQRRLERRYGFDFADAENHRWTSGLPESLPRLDVAIAISRDLGGGGRVPFLLTANEFDVDGGEV
ncbi:hypothetical protein P0W64_09330 [Tsukamurella sp. 8F]|uniref:hypothetical protein n=1 Tax=unclassified Tsukamurella TaxID=2633480 RepID=UPI0023B99114|nr:MULTISPECIES: hypothetical protein [unclassified Tsukamurella]MDF0529781.1 hypothetical protein [Tsukamurella sp. 8J]MDF0586973.1 hypothetical protein [Tsukamurella sp. 8F]